MENEKIVPKPIRIRFSHKTDKSKPCFAPLTKEERSSLMSIVRKLWENDIPINISYEPLPNRETNFPDYQKNILEKNNGCLCGYGSMEMDINLNIITDSHFSFDCPIHSLRVEPDRNMQLPNDSPPN